MCMATGRPDRQADELDSVMGWYRLQRGIVGVKCAGLSESDARRIVIPTSPLMTVAGVVSHLRWTEELWFSEVLQGKPGVGSGFDGADDSEFEVGDATLAQLLDEYEAAAARSDAAIEAAGFDATGSTALHSVGEASVRWMVLHMLEETARHVGQLDIIRELLDGTKSYY